MALTLTRVERIDTPRGPLLRVLSRNYFCVVTPHEAADLVVALERDPDVGPLLERMRAEVTGVRR